MEARCSTGSEHERVTRGTNLMHLRHDCMCASMLLLSVHKDMWCLLESCPSSLLNLLCCIASLKSNTRTTSFQSTLRVCDALSPTEAKPQAPARAARKAPARNAGLDKRSPHATRCAQNGVLTYVFRWLGRFPTHDLDLWSRTFG